MGNRTPWVLYSVSFILLLLLGGCSGESCGPIVRALGVCSTKPVIKIGLVAPFEGRYRALGYEALYAVKLAVRECNAQGGVAGHMVELVALDDGDDPSWSEVQAHKFAIDEDLMGVVGPFSDAAVRMVAPAYRELGLPAITPATCASSIATGEGGLHCLGADVGLLVEAMTGAVPPEQTVVWIRADASAEDVPLSGESQEVVPKMVPLDSWQAYPADVYLYDGDVLTAADLLIEMREAGVGAPLLSGPMVARTQLSQIAGAAVDGACHAITDPLFATHSDSFADGYVELAGISPGPWAALAYDAAFLLLDGLQRAIEETGQPTREGLNAALVDVRGPDGSAVFVDGRRRQAGVTLYCYKAGDGYPGVPRR